MLYDFVEFLLLLLEPISRARVLDVVVEERLNATLFALFEDLLEALLLAVGGRATHDLVHVEARHVVPGLEGSRVLAEDLLFAYLMGLLLPRRLDETGLLVLVRYLLLGKAHVLFVMALLDLRVLSAFLVIVLGCCCSRPVAIVKDDLVLLRVSVCAFSRCLLALRCGLGCLSTFEVVIFANLELRANIDSLGFASVTHVLQSQAHESDRFDGPRLVEEQHTVLLELVLSMEVVRKGH